MEKRKPFLLMLSSDSDLWNSSSSFSSPPDCSFCFLFFLRFLLSFALLELNLEASDELSESLPAALGSLEWSEVVAAAACYIEEKRFQYSVIEDLVAHKTLFMRYIQLTERSHRSCSVNIWVRGVFFFLLKAFRDNSVFLMVTFIMSVLCFRD